MSGDTLDVTRRYFDLGRHPNTIAYPEKFFESAQAIATHSHLRWPDLSREWIRRQQARIARVDWESRLPLIVGPRKSRLSLFTRKQQKLLKKAREMSGTPDLSALLKGKLQLLKKSATTGSPTRLNEADASPKERSESLEQAADADPPAAEPAKKRSQKKGGKKNVPSKGKKDPKDGSHSGEGSLEGSLVEKKKKTKRSRESHGDGEGRDGSVMQFHLSDADCCGGIS
ncbi:hypothetical protein Bca52824_032732 [Brassica carinata]|uniref:Uncharacterized protein n=1 Tax=Brassica carinata TaxID=52824 RepID=A0A8X7V7U2_BRACI|nr:hypothetical protein Bca52824_032732 [Brassica carinata]